MEVFKSEATVAKPEETWLNSSVNCCALCTTACRSEILLGLVERVCNELNRLDKSAVKPFGLEVELLVICSFKYASASCNALCWEVSEPVTLPSAAICASKRAFRIEVIETTSTPVPSSPAGVCSGGAAWMTSCCRA